MTTAQADALDRLRRAIAKGDAAVAADEVHAHALTLVGQQVTLTTYDLGGQEFERTGKLVRIEPWAQYPWTLVLLPKGKRVHGQRYIPETVLGIRHAGE